MNTTPDNHLETHLRETFRRSCAEIDQRHLHRLMRARRDALAPQPRLRAGRLLFPAGAVAASLLAVVLVWKQPGANSVPGQAQVTQLASVPAPDDADVEFFGDLEFYRWLAAQSTATAPR